MGSAASATDERDGGKGNIDRPTTWFGLCREETVAATASYDDADFAKVSLRGPSRFVHNSLQSSELPSGP